MKVFLSWFKKYGAFLWLLGLLIFVFPNEYKEFWEKWWQLLIFIMFLGPVSQVFPKIPFLRKILPLRRQLGIICACLIIAHGIGAYRIGWDISLQTLTEPKDFLFWWMLGWICAIPLLLTSNNKAVKILKKHWKTVQRLAYFFFLFWGIHIYLIEKDIGILLILWVWIILKVLAAKKVVLWK